uniref:Uncharacterized protein n=1 Tax=Rhizophora mucronata TaxID=61149 RepID=A0A2P2J1Z8_RHIMU
MRDKTKNRNSQKSKNSKVTLPEEGRRVKNSENEDSTGSIPPERVWCRWMRSGTGVW